MTTLRWRAAALLRQARHAGRHAIQNRNYAVNKRARTSEGLLLLLLLVSNTLTPDLNCRAAKQSLASSRFGLPSPSDDNEATLTHTRTRTHTEQVRQIN